MVCFVEVSTKYSSTPALYFHFLRQTIEGKGLVGDTDPRRQECIHISAFKMPAKCLWEAATVGDDRLDLQPQMQL